MSLEKPPQSAEINLERFKSLSDGDNDSLIELIELYRSKTSEQLQELRSAIQTQALGEVARVAHSMIGANAMVGMETILPSLRKLEEFGEKKAFSEAKQALQIVIQEFERIDLALRPYAPLKESK